MEKYLLARELRQRQYDFGALAKCAIDAISDDEIIDCYITCACCGEKQTTPQQLEVAIKLAVSLEHFFRLCNHFAYTRHLRTSVFVPRRGFTRSRARRRR